MLSDGFDADDTTAAMDSDIGFTADRGGGEGEFEFDLGADLEFGVGVNENTGGTDVAGDAVLAGEAYGQGKRKTLSGSDFRHWSASPLLEKLRDDGLYHSNRRTELSGYSRRDKKNPPSLTRRGLKGWLRSKARG